MVFQMEILSNGKEPVIHFYKVKLFDDIKFINLQYLLHKFYFAVFKFELEIL